MNDAELLQGISAIVFGIPDKLFLYSRPSTCFEEDWESASGEEKAYYLVKQLLIDKNIEAIKNKRSDSNNTSVLKLGKCPTFFSSDDEDMFFNAIYSIPSYIEVIGTGNELYLTHRNPMAREEKESLKGLLNRYQVKIPRDLM